MMEMIHFIVESLDKHFGNVCELDILFHLDEVGRRNHEEKPVLEECRISLKTDSKITGPPI